MHGYVRIRVGMTSTYAVLGSPISHSLSPLIHRAAFEFQGIEATYEAIEVGQNLLDFLANRTEAGFSITMPLKEQALSIANRADSLSIAANSANTLIRTEEGFDAYNTDVFGIQKALAGCSGKEVAVFGTGATARSAIIAMLEKDKRVAIWGRSSEKARLLALEFNIEIIDKLYVGATFPIVISTLPPHGLDEYLASIRTAPDSTLLDVAYNPWPSMAAELWGKSGKVVSGLEMLIWQAVAQQRLFAGLEIDESLKDEAGLVKAIKAALKMAK